MNKIINIVEEFVNKSIISFWQFLFIFAAVLYYGATEYKPTTFFNSIDNENIDFILYVLYESFTVYITLVLIFVVVVIVVALISKFINIESEDHVIDGIEHKTVGFWNESKLFKYYYDFPYIWGTRYFSIYLLTSAIFMRSESIYSFSKMLENSIWFELLFSLILFLNVAEFGIKVITKLFYVEYTVEKTEVSYSDYSRSVILEKENNIVLCRLHKNSNKYYVLERIKETSLSPRYNIILSTTNFDEAVFKYKILTKE